MLKFQLKLRLSVVALGLLLCVAAPIFGQEPGQKIAELLACANDQYGTPDYLVSGQAYQSSNPRADGTANFLFSDWTEGVLYVQGKIYDKALIKYDLQKDVLALKQNLKSGVPIQVALNPNMVDSFQLADHHFVSKPETGIGYLELIYQGKRQYLQKHRKKFVTDNSIGSQYGKFIEESTYYYIFTDSEYQEVSGRKDFLLIFEDHKKAIKKYLRDYGIKFQKANQEQLYHLFKYVDGL